MISMLKHALPVEPSHVIQHKQEELKAIPVQNIESDIGSSVANVAEVVGSDAADVHAHFAWGLRLESLLLLRQGVENLKRVVFHYSSQILCSSKTLDGVRSPRRKKRGALLSNGFHYTRKNCVNVCVDDCVIFAVSDPIPTMGSEL